MVRESILDVFPTESGHQRLVVASETCAADCAVAPERLVLRQESYSDHVGWFVQSRISIEPEQLPAIKALFTSRPNRPIRGSLGEPSAEPVILRFPIAG